MISSIKMLTTHQDVKMIELEKEKDYLHSKIANLERINKELLSYKKELEKAISEIS